MPARYTGFHEIFQMKYYTGRLEQRFNALIPRFPGNNFSGKFVSLNFLKSLCNAEWRVAHY